MTPDEIEKDRAPERIWSSLDSFGFRKSVSPYSQTLAKSTEYVRSDLFDALTAENARLRDALEFYADKAFDGYDVSITDYGLSTELGEIIKDGGDRARAALGEKNDG